MILVHSTFAILRKPTCSPMEKAAAHEERGGILPQRTRFLCALHAGYRLHSAVVPATRMRTAQTASLARDTKMRLVFLSRPPPL